MSDKPERLSSTQPADGGRRRFLFGASALPAVAGAGLPTGLALASTPARAALKTAARIVIAGSGLGGLAIASRLARELDGAKITVIDRKEIHNYQPGYTLVGTGIWPVGKVSDRNADLMPQGVDWMREMVAEFDPEADAVVTDRGQRIEYDYLIVATGLHLDYAQIEGMDVAAIGSKGLGSIYPGPDAAEATWRAMDAFRQKGGSALMTLPETFLKCAGAPLKVTFMVADRLKQAGTRDASRIAFHSALDNIFSVPRINDEVLRRWEKLDIPVTFHSKLVAIDIGSRRATMARPEGGRTEIDYDFIHVVPPMRAPDAIVNSPLPWRDGGFAAGSWLEVDPKTLRHRRFPNVFGLGDVNGTGKGKTAATIKKSAPIVAQNLIDVIAGREPSQHFDGYTSCPLLLREGSALLVEFDYNNNLTPSLPMIDPLQDSYFAWVMKYRLLKPAYMAVAKGRV
ncbi:NAD(P)/FAD-dependent oxidoreductase [Thauera linaloolentis]|uniref:FAD-dependent pyridine nucleotide-disulfide oxidoreductase n=1 Tax=Thauera linaloolentis (strain DSM 12138 / JCM 21573 / CCUG 41526 / CIP 105981 / IAM 15112 / NBRC 102519 / 47Lol) TaxID=1123367 RepID=N6Y703_THAL4|nr:FAD/NAD(P)-binding oxidoreductase [Thauera linaloolentis]ENO90021.1 FAD-dependent pyridine nucleotide-disulfide oxidoreductase [Thauera linaloolentis 47Lol = DSM 12138]MCM8565304.1 NAD(P)/FAD-dependent oxidoreductase [Thauera linaloolentis]